MLSQELMRNAKAPNAFDIPSKSLGRELQRRAASAHPPVANSYFLIPKAGSHHHSQRIARAAI